MTEKSKPLGVILAGGRATRMGGVDKALLPLGNVPILARVITKIRPQTSEIMINANGDPHRFAAFGCPVIADSIAGFPGPLAGVLAGLDWAYEKGADRIVTVAADTPFFPDDLVARFEATSAGQTHPLVLAVTPRRDGETTKSMSRSGQIRHPTFGLWPVSLRDDLRDALAEGLSKVVIWTDRHGGKEAMFDAGGRDPFFNVNTPDDLRKAEKLL